MLDRCGAPQLAHRVNFSYYEPASRLFEGDNRPVIGHREVDRPDGLAPHQTWAIRLGLHVPKTEPPSILVVYRDLPERITAMIEPHVFDEAIRKPVEPAKNPGRDQFPEQDFASRGGIELTYGNQPVARSGEKAR